MKNLLNFKDFNLIIENEEFEVFLEFNDDLDDLNEGKKSPIETALRNKAKKSGFPLGILRQVYKRGHSSWKLGHRPGTTPQQWAMARVNSFIVGGKTTKMSDKALYQQAKKQMGKRKRK